QTVTSKGDRVLLLYAPGLDFVVGFLACLYAGVIAVTAYPPASRRHLPRLRSLAADAEPSVALSTADLLPKLRAARLPELESVTWLAGDTVDDDEAAAWRPHTPSPDDLAFLQYTSGSTAAPKGVMVSHGNLMHNEEVIRRGFGTQSDDIIVGWLPLYHDMGLIGNVLHPLYLGARCVLMAPVAFLQQPRRWLDAIHTWRGTVSGGPNFSFDLCVAKVGVDERPAVDLSSWRLAFSGAEPVRASSLDGFARAFAPAGFRKTAFFPCYGMAETTLMATGGPAEDDPVTTSFDEIALADDRAVPATGENSRTLIGCGVHGWELDVTVVDPVTLERVDDGNVGEVWVRGDSVARGYWRNPERTASDFAARLADQPDSSGTWLRTGDLGFVHGAQLFPTGRLKDLIIVRGRNHYPQDIELTAEDSHGSIRRGCSAAFGIDDDGEERLVIVAELLRHPSDEPDVIADAVRRAVAATHQLQVHDVTLIRTGSILKTSSGKIRRSACRDAWRAGEFPVLTASVTSSETETDVIGSELRLDRAALDQVAPAEARTLLVRWLVDRFARLARVAVRDVDPTIPLTAQGL
ncbi:MAG: fatty acyl-AMP ligase, partial [Acidobacteriota bacterium]